MTIKTALHEHDYCLSCGVKASAIGKSLLIWDKWNGNDSYHRCVFCIAASKYPANSPEQTKILITKMETLAMILLFGKEVAKVKWG